MCGIAGQVAGDSAPPERDLLERMAGALIHRGPDSAGFHTDGRVGLAIRRLAIIDVQGGDQPLYSEDGSLAVVCNGEIYNFQELRAGLEARGHRFKTGSDAETLVHLYEEHGPRLVEHLRGMFAFALWDARRERMVLGRDRVGKKPLYYFHHPDGGLSFSSELASLLEDAAIERRLDPRAIDAFLNLLYVPHPLCAIEGVQKLPPASVLVWEGGKIDVQRYWRLDYSVKDRLEHDEIPEHIWEHLKDAVGVRLISERPLGAFLSGGVDSAAVVAAMAEQASGPVKTFSIGFESDRFNELPYARRVAELYGTDHTEFVVQPDALEVLPKLITHYGDPFGDSSAIPSFYVARMARREVVVALNGDGGDESFAGYNRYVSNGFAERLHRIPAPARRAMAIAASSAPVRGELNTPVARVRRLAMSLPLPPDKRYLMYMSYLSDELRASLYEPEFRARTMPPVAGELYAEAWRTSTATAAVDRMLDVDVLTYLPGDLLAKMDIATMANSLEARSPFLDHHFMEMAARLPSSAKVKGTTTKVALKEMMRRRIPAEIIDRPKQGFSVPLAEWLRGPLKPVVQDVLLEPRTLDRGLFRPAAVKDLVRDHVEHRANRASELWLLLVLELWQRRFIDGVPESALL